MPSVIMISARWRNRAMMKLVSIAERCPPPRRDDKPGQWLAPAPFGKQSRSIGADAEIGGVAERYDSGKAEDEIERQREQRR